MSEQPLAIADASPHGVSLDESRSSRRVRWFELVLLLSIAVGPYVYSGLFALVTGHPHVVSAQSAEWGFSLFHEITSLLLLGYILSRRQLKFADLGLRWSFRAAGTGIALAVAGYCAYVLGVILVVPIHNLIYGAAPADVSKAMLGHAGFVAIPFVLVNPFFEELIVRAYLMKEIRELTGSPVLAVIASVVVQTTYHLYQGWVGALTVAFTFLVYAIYYARTRHATPIVVSHGIFDLLTISRVW